MSMKGWIFVGTVVLILALIISWRKGTTVTDDLLTEYDYIIVGAGSPGSVMAARLSEEKNVTVLLLEAGGDDSVGAGSAGSVLAARLSEDKNMTVLLLEAGGDDSVGAGSAGSVLAARLSEDKNVTVLLLEAGGDDSGNFILSVPFLNALTQHSNVDWGFYSEPQKHSSFDFKEKRMYYPRGKCLGGTSNLNAMIVTRGSRHDYDGWAKMGCQGWGYNEVLPYFLKSENILVQGLENSEYHNKGGELPVSSERFTSLQELFIEAGKELGYKEVDYNGKDMIGVSDTQGSITHNGLRASTSRMFLRPVMDRTILHISINSHVHKVMIENKNAVGVVFSKYNATHKIKAKREVILSAGSVQSPQILMLSGIGHKGHLKENGIDVVHDLPVGDNLQDHIYAYVPTFLNVSDLMTHSTILSFSNMWKYLVHGKGVFRNTGPITSLGFLQLDEASRDSSPGLPDTQFQVIPALYQNDPDTVIRIFGLNNESAEQLYESSKKANGRPGFVLLSNVAHPKSRGTIRLNSKDPFEPPAIDPNYFSHPDDIKLSIKGMREAKRFLKTKIMKDKGADPDDPDLRHTICTSKHEYDSDEFWECFIRSTATTVYHTSGTCKMGPIDDQSTVVDAQLRVKGISGLRVVDASIIPLIPSGNTNAPTIMIAEKAADMIRGIDSVKHLRNRVKNL